MRAAAGIGLVALDVVVDEDAKAQLGKWAGGSCGNVMAILAFLGWDASPIARLDDARRSQLIRSDLARWGVNDRWLGLPPTTSAPVYIERLKRGVGGATYHRFERFCPACGSRLPPHRAVTRQSLEPIVHEIARCDVLYLDRPSAGAIFAAEHARDQGSLVVFEPSARGTGRQLAELAGLADVVKYSADRLTREDRRSIAAVSPRVEIETLGQDGLRYRTARKWHRLDVARVQARDTAGAGDWTTAGFIHRLPLRAGKRVQLTSPVVRDALRDAQALGALSCLYPGARGAMERNSRSKIWSAARALRQGDRHTGRRRSQADTTLSGTFACDCG